MSATLGHGFLETVDRKADGLDTLTSQDQIFLQVIKAAIVQDNNPEARNRRGAMRAVQWFTPSRNKTSFPEQIADKASKEHVNGTLSLVVCNTVNTAHEIFRALNVQHKVLLTSRFRRQDREHHEQCLLKFEAKRRQNQGKPVPDDPGLICVSTQVVEAGIDISAHRLWSELSPWPSVIQRLGRLNRDGQDQTALAWFWETPKVGRGKPEQIGPYEADDIKSARNLLAALSPISKIKAFPLALEELQEQAPKDCNAALQARLTPLPRALDIHGLFSTECDLHGGFTNVSDFVRSHDRDADLTVFWREWSGDQPPQWDELNGPNLDVHSEGCQVAYHRLRKLLKSTSMPAWIWNDEDGKWERLRHKQLCPGMVAMLHRSVGGYCVELGWTGNSGDVPDNVPSAGSGRVLRDDTRTETGCWVGLDVHLADARDQAVRLCDAVDLGGSERIAVIEAAAFHDLGKAHPQWQQALPAIDGLAGGPWAKCPRVIAVDAVSNEQEIRNAVLKLRPGARALADEQGKRGRERVTRLRWAVSKQFTREERSALQRIKGLRWIGHAAFRPGQRHEAASALAMWKHYRDGKASYPALAVYLAAAHHGKVRTVLRRTTTDHVNDVFGVPRDSAALYLPPRQWPLDFTVAKDGAEGRWEGDHFMLTAHGWTGLVADLLGSWRADDATGAAVVPENEPRQLGPFALAYLEALVRIADWRASDKPSTSTRPEEMTRDE